MAKFALLHTRQSFSRSEQNSSLSARRQQLLEIAAPDRQGGPEVPTPRFRFQPFLSFRKYCYVDPNYVDYDFHFHNTAWRQVSRGKALCVEGMVRIHASLLGAILPGLFYLSCF